jgi:hypothetical protein
LLEPGEAGWVLEVEVVGGISRHDLPGQSGFAALTWADQPNDAAAL